MTERINCLPIIASWLEEFSYHDSSGMSRIDLQDWLTSSYDKSRYKLDSEEKISLALDCLAAVGIGREEEQSGTIYCSCCY